MSSPDGWKNAAEEVRAKRARIADAGRSAAVEAQHARGKLTARERVGRLFDAGSFLEIGALVEPNRDLDDVSVGDAPADGVVTGSGLLAGRPAWVIAMDFTVYGGSMAKVGGLKIESVLRRALEDGAPVVMLMEGGGHRIQEALDSRHFSHGAVYFDLLGQLSGWVPLVAAIMGPGFAGPTNFAAFADFVVAVGPTSTMGIAGPALVKAATGEDLDKFALGGAREQADRNGLIDVVVEDDDQALAAVRRYLSFLPGNSGEPPPSEPPSDPCDRRSPDLTEIVPQNPRRAFDVRKVVAAIADADSVLEIKPSYARNLVTAFARMGGRPVGILANQSMVLAGTLDSPACEKGAHFIAVCDAFGLPLIFLIDVPGFLVGSQAERSGLGRRSGRLLHELGQATVPRCSVVLRKGFGLAYIAMCGGRSYHTALSLAWPSAEISAMAVEGAVDVAYRKQVEAAPDPEAARAAMIRNFKAKLGPSRAAEGFGVDDVIDPADTRPMLIAALARSAPRRATSGPPKRRSISPI